MKVIDFRLRPPTEEYKRSHRGLDALLKNYGPESWYNSNLAACIREMEESNIISVLMGRQTPPDLAISNDHLKELIDDYPGRFVAMGGIDPSKRRPCQDEIERIAKLGFKGVHFDHGLLNPPMRPDDKRLYPIYAQCEDMKLIVCLQMGPMAVEDLSYVSPLNVEQVAKDFPSLRIVMCHGCWPFIDETFALIWRRSNVWVSPDSYQFRPGGMRYLEACNSGGPLQERYLYGSSYPYGPGMKARLEDWKKLPWKENIVEKLLYKNGALLLGLET